MIQLTEQQRQAVKACGAGTPTVVDPDTNITYVLIRKEVYDQLKTEYDTGPWAEEEMDLLAAEAGDLLDNYRKEP